MEALTYIVIPTVGRNEKLIKLIESVDAETPIVVMKDPIYRGSVWARNFALKGLEGNILYATDDIEFTPGAINEAIHDLYRVFPDTDGVIGLTQKTKHHPSGVALVGLAFMKRYPERKLFNPAYHHFAAQEVYDYAQSLRKFYKSKATIIHNQDFKDNTAIQARIHKSRDFKRYENRKSIWPK